VRWAFVAAFVFWGCGASASGTGVSGVTDVAVSAEPAGSAAEADSDHPPAEPRRAAVEHVVPTEVPPEPPGSPADLATARALFAEGVKAFQAGDLATAEAKFSKAYGVAPRAPVLFNLAKVLMMEGKTREACAAYERWWVSLSPPDPSKRSELPSAAQCPNLAALP